MLVELFVIHTCDRSIVLQLYSKLPVKIQMPSVLHQSIDGNNISIIKRTVNYVEWVENMGFCSDT